MSDAYQVGQKLVELCKQNRWRQAIETLYGQNIVCIEPFSAPDFPARVEGLDRVKAKTDWWEKNHEVHGAEIRGPWPNGDRFIVYFKLDVTPKAGPMAGKRFIMEETGLYTVKDGKIVQEEFFYHRGA